MTQLVPNFLYPHIMTMRQGKTWRLCTPVEKTIIPLCAANISSSKTHKIHLHRLWYSVNLIWKWNDALKSEEKSFVHSSMCRSKGGCDDFQTCRKSTIQRLYLDWMVKTRCYLRKFEHINQISGGMETNNISVNFQSSNLPTPY